MPISLGTTTITALFLGTTSITSAYLGATQVFGGASAFTPLDLFSTGSQGVWYDPSDLTTMFVDRAGTTPVTSPGQLVGLRLDKSKGLVLGSELVPNPGNPFASAANWSPATASLSVVSGNLRISGSGTFARAAASITGLTVGKTYKLVARLVETTATDSAIWATSGFSYTTIKDMVSGSVLEVIGTATATSMSVTLYTTRTADGTGKYSDWSGVSVRELSGNHATAPTDAARPTYGVEPKGGRRNLLTWSEGFDNAVWVKAALTVTDNAEGIADKLTPTTTSFSHTVQATVSSSGVNTFTIEAKNAGYNFLNIAINNAAATAASYNLTTGGITLVGGSVLSDDFEDLGDGWGRLTLTATTTITSVRLYVSNAEGFAAFAGDGTSGVLVRKAQLELGSTATPYQRVTIAEDVTEVGVPTCHYLRYDGFNSSMSTAAIDFTATDKMSVFAGVNKTTNGNNACIVELSANAPTNSGTFYIVTGRQVSGTAPAYTTLSRGTVSATADSADLYNAPVNNLLAFLGDISGDTATFRINGSQVAQSTGNQGTGNYGNHPLFLGRRNNATLPFNGRDFGIIVVGKTASAGEITDTETWLAAKTSGVTL